MCCFLSNDTASLRSWDSSFGRTKRCLPNRAMLCYSPPPLTIPFLNRGRVRCWRLYSGLLSSYIHQVVWWVCLLRLRVAGIIEENPGPEVLDPCSVCGKRVSGGWLSIRCSVCEQWCHRRCSGICSEPEFRRLAPWSCPSCNDPVPPSTPSRSPESSGMVSTRLLITSSSGTFFSATSGSWGGGSSGSFQSQPYQDNATANAARVDLGGGNILQFNCNGIRHCHAELQDFLHKNHEQVACLQETKLVPGSALEEFRGCITIRRDRTTRGGGVLYHTRVRFRRGIRLIYYQMMGQQRSWG